MCRRFNSGSAHYDKTLENSDKWLVFEGFLLREGFHYVAMG